MTDDMDLGALLIAEAARRNAILDKTVFEQLQNGFDNCAEDKRYLEGTAQEHADELLMYSPDFEDEKWDLDRNYAALVASCQRWLDMRRSTTAV